MRRRAFIKALLGGTVAAFIGGLPAQLGPGPGGRSSLAVRFNYTAKRVIDRFTEVRIDPVTKSIFALADGQWHDIEDVHEVNEVLAHILGSAQDPTMPLGPVPDVPHWERDIERRAGPPTVTDEDGQAIEEPST